LREAEEAARAEEPPERVLNLIPTNPPCPAKPRIRTIRSRVLVQVPPGVSVLGEAGRERLWAASGLPVFEQLCGLGGEVLASECDAHEGYHLDTNAAVFELLDGGLVLTSLEGLRYPTLRVRTGWPGIIQRNACPCGSPSPRFLSASSASLR
jgi:hypothetical protein